MDVIRTGIIRAYIGDLWRRPVIASGARNWRCSTSHPTISSRRCCTADHWPRESTRRRHCCTASRIGAKHGGTRWTGINGAHSGDAAQLIRRYAHCISCNVTRVEERIARNCSEAIRRTHIGVANLVATMRPIRPPASTSTRRLARARFSRAVVVRIVDIGVVVNIVYCGDVRDPRIGDVDAVEVASAHAIPRNERLTEPKRTPAVAVPATEAEAYTPARPAEPSN